MAKKDKSRKAYIVKDGKLVEVASDGLELENPNENDRRKWFTGGALEDGWSWDNLGKTILGTAADFGTDLAEGLLNVGESAIDTGAYLLGGVGGLFSKEFQSDVSKFIAKDILYVPGSELWEGSSVLGDPADSIVQSGSQLLAQIGLQATGVPWWMTAGISSFGGELESAFNYNGGEGVDYNKAGLSALVAAGGEIISEKLLDGFGFQGGGWFDSVTDELVRKIGAKTSSKVLATLSKIGFDMAGEGLEEIFSGVINAFGQKLTYASEEELFGKDGLFSSDDAIEAFIGGAALAGIGGGIRSQIAKKKGVNYTTGFTDAEQKVVDKILEQRLQEKQAEAEKNGEKSNFFKDAKTKNEMIDEIRKEMERGEIPLDIIESVLDEGGFKELEDMLAKADEYDKISEDLKQGKEITDEQKALLESFDSEEGQAEYTKQLMEGRTKISRRVIEMVAKDRNGKPGLLARSYAEDVKSKQKFEANTSNMKDGNYKQTVQKAIDSGILNNTRATHEFVDFVANIAAKTGIDVDFADNQKLMESGFAVKDAVINGIKSGNKIILNVNAKKALNKVVGHEVAHFFEGTKFYDDFQKAVFDYAKSKRDFIKRRAAISDLYKDVSKADIDAELTADLVGDYLFTDENFIRDLSFKKPNIFQRLYENIKHLCKLATAGSKEARELEKVKHIFQKVIREGANTKAKAGTGVKYSLTYTTDNKAVAVIENDIFDGKFNDLSDSERIKIVKESIKSFRPGVPISGRLIGVSRKTAGHFTNSDYTDQIRNNNQKLYEDKLNLAQNIDDVIYASTDYINEDLKHTRTDNIIQFARGSVLLDIGGNKYDAHVLVGYTSSNEMILYDVQDLTPTTFQLKEKKKTQPKLTGNESEIRKTVELSSKDIVPQNSEKSIGNEKNPTENPISKDANAETSFSLTRNAEMMDNVEEYNKNHLGINLDQARQQRQIIYDYMIKNASKLKLPEDIEGNTAVKNSSYDITEENTTVCIRSMAADALCDAVAENLGRPLTVQETLQISQDLMNYTDEPECVYCYVATDRRAYREFLGSYYDQMQSTIEALKKGDYDTKSYTAEQLNKMTHEQKNNSLYWKFLDGRKPTKNMKARYDMWMEVASGGKMISSMDLASEKMMQLAMKDPELAAQIKDARAYAQSASWANKRIGYQAYDGHILTWSDKRISDLNKHYGLRFYSFSDFSPAFVLENMQQMTDAAARGLKGLAYTKVLDFAEIFAPTGININISVFGYTQNGAVAQDGMMGADWKGAQDLRNRYENVGITFVATNDAQIEWALAQDWIDVVIPYHLVRTGQAVAKHFGYTNYTAKSSDTKGANWKKGDKKTIYPAEHNNDKQTYLKALEKANLEPRFARWVDNPNYMKLVKETRRSASDTPPMKAEFNVEAAKDSLERMAKQGGYFVPIGGDYANMQDIASDIADTIRGKKLSLSSTKDVAEAPTKGYNVRGEDVALNAPDEATAVSESLNDEVTAPTGNGNIARGSIVKAHDRGNYGTIVSFNPETGKYLVNFKSRVGTQANISLDASEFTVVSNHDRVKRLYAKSQTDNGDTISKLLDEEVLGQSPEKRKLLTMARTYLLDKFSIFEDLSLKTNNRALMDKANNMLYSEQKAQRMIGEGVKSAGIKSLNEIRDTVQSSEYGKEFEDYMHNLLNIDRMSIEERASKVLRDLKKDFGHLSEDQLYAIANEKITKKTTLKRKQTIDNAQKYLWAQGAVNKPVFGYDVTADMSRKITQEYEEQHPEFIEWARDVYDYVEYLRDILVEKGVISQETADLWAEEYPHYIPIKRAGKGGAAISVALDTNKTGVNAPIKAATGGDSPINPMWNTLADRTLQTFKAADRNSFGVELMNTLGSQNTSNEADLDSVIDSVDTHEDLLQKGDGTHAPTFTVFKDGKRVTFDITADMYDALKPSADLFNTTIKPLNAMSNFMRGVLTEYNPVFTITNFAKDIQDVLLNSQHAGKTYKTIPKAAWELLKYNVQNSDKKIAQKLNDTKLFNDKGSRWVTEYLENGGEQNTYFDKAARLFNKDDAENASALKKAIGIPLNAISTANNFIEMVPRLAEYIASRQLGRSIEGSMLDAARVTTNFAAGADLTKWANRNGATFLNASVQGFNQQIRNIREAKQKGLKGWLGLAAKVAVAGLPVFLLNVLLWRDDEEYEQLSDYVKENYYIVAKSQDGTFVRIPKGRALAVIQDGLKQMHNLVTGDDEVDMNTFFEIFMRNLAPNDPLDNNVFAPIIQAHTNTAWFGGEIVPQRLQDLPNAEQYDETTDALSKWLGEQTNMSPYRLNYLINQYSGGIGDVILPMITPEATRQNNSLGGYIIAPLADKFTTNAVMNNQGKSDFYDVVDTLAKKANSKKASDSDKLKYKYVTSINKELSDLYKLQREVQNSTLGKDEKYEQVYSLQQQINQLTQKALDSYNDVSVFGEYATVGDLSFRFDDGEWKKLSEDQLNRQYEITDALNITPGEYWNNKEEFDYAFNSPAKYAISKTVGGYLALKDYSKVFSDIVSDKDKDGKVIANSRKQKVMDYINGLKLDYGMKIILYKSEYPSDDTYNMDIINYINSRKDLSYEEKAAALVALGFNVDNKGNISW